MLEVRALTKRYGGLLAVDKVSFTVNRGEVVGNSARTDPARARRSTWWVQAFRLSGE
jgi:ABC-type phosphonate transport system ATPase subunit